MNDSLKSGHCASRRSANFGASVQYHWKYKTLIVLGYIYESCKLDAYEWRRRLSGEILITNTQETLGPDHLFQLSEYINVNLFQSCDNWNMWWTL